MSPRPSLVALFAPLFAGLTLVTAVHAVLTPMLVGFGYFDAKFLVLEVNGLLGAGVIGLYLWLKGGFAGDHVRYFWAGVGLGLGALVSAWIFAIPFLDGIREGEIVPGVFGILSSIALMVILAATGKRAPNMPTCVGVTLVAVAACAALFLRVGVNPPETIEVALPAPPPDKAAPGAGPDVILVSIDTLRAAAFGSYGLDLPTVARLKGEGIYADHALAPAPMTLPSHATMLSGRSPLFHSAWNNAGVLPPGDKMPMLAHFFRTNGWRTMGVASNGVIRASNGFDHGFELYENLAYKSDIVVSGKRLLRVVARHCTWSGWLMPMAQTDFVTLLLSGRRHYPRQHTEVTVTATARDRALEYLDHLIEDESPYFLFVHFLDPHHPYNPPKKFRGKIADPSQMPEKYRKHPLGEKKQMDAIENDMLAGEPVGFEGVEVLHDLYKEEVLFIDSCLAALLERVDRAGRDTVILVTSDHGEQFGEHGYTNHGNTLYEPLITVPFILAGTGVTQGARFARRPRLEDIAPTLLGLAGIPAPDVFDGIDLVGSNAIDEPPYWSWRPEQFAYREDNWKLIGTFERSEAGYTNSQATELYDLAMDPAEENNLLDSQPDRVERMLEEARILLADARMGGDVELSEDERQQMIELGYIDPGDDDH